jgi:hypothetical protein
MAALGLAGKLSVLTPFCADPMTSQCNCRPTDYRNGPINSHYNYGGGVKPASKGEEIIDQLIGLQKVLDDRA